MAVSHRAIGTKRQTDALLSDQSPDTKRQKVAADPISKTSSASPAPSPARIPQNQRFQQAMSPQVSQLLPTTVPSQPVQSTTSVPASTPATATPVPLPPSGPSMPVINSEVFDQVIAPRGLKFGQTMERLKALEREIAAMDAQISNAQNTGQAAVLAVLQEDLARMTRLREQIKMLLRQHYRKMLLAKEALIAHAGATGSVLPNTSAEAGPSTQSHPPNASGVSSERPVGSTMEEHKPAISDSQILTQFWQSRGGMVSTSNSSTPQAGPSQTQLNPAVNPEVAAQMQKLIEKKGIRPPSFGSSSQPPGTTSHETPANPNAPNTQALPAWQGTFSWTPPKLSGQVANEMQIHVVGIIPSPTPNDV